jgi:hypothetical protein
MQRSWEGKTKGGLRVIDFEDMSFMVRTLYHVQWQALILVVFSCQVLLAETELQI